jgi:hypothetical protein
MSRLQNIPETCPIYKEAEHLFECLKDEIEVAVSDKELAEYFGARFIDYAKSILKCVDQCRDISGELRAISVERGEKIEELEEKLGDLLFA